MENKTVIYKGGRKMKKILFGTVLLALVSIVSFPARARAYVDVNVSIGLPPLIVFASPPELIVLPDTYVYVVPDVDDEIFFYDGWWWRPWEGRWYRSHYYDRGWGYYNSVPSFYFDVDPGWRGYYRDRNWSGHQWNYERIPRNRLQQNWKSWQTKRHWERQGTWGVQGYQPRPQEQRQELRQQRQNLYQQRPEVQKQRQHKVEQQIEQPKEKAQRQQKLPKVEKQKEQPKEKAQRQQRQPKVEQQKEQPKEKPERDKEEKQDRR
jgi:hypothetical protein